MLKFLPAFRALLLSFMLFLGTLFGVAQTASAVPENTTFPAQKSIVRFMRSPLLAELFLAETIPAEEVLEKIAEAPAIEVSPTEAVDEKEAEEAAKAAEKAEKKAAKAEAERLKEEQEAAEEAAEEEEKKLAKAAKAEAKAAKKAAEAEMKASETESAAETD
ncbi:hypothetical protein [Leptolyngbya ohadii]|uniref:hypothetical protein n=1 Tax=Leptolyngbya ohadii TaxID=1962290 RepID=UPI000B5A05DC|nr:hypothetical protein [Leptolyngbya ohadii]